MQHNLCFKNLIWEIRVHEIHYNKVTIFIKKNEFIYIFFETLTRTKITWTVKKSAKVSNLNV